MSELKKEFEKSEVENFEDWDKKTQEKWLKKYPYPTGFSLPKSADIETIEKIFTK